MDYGIEGGFYISLYFFVQFPNYPLYFQAFGACIALFFWLVKSILEAKPVYRHFPWNFWILLLNIYIWLMLLWSIDPGKTILYNLVFTNGSVFMVILASCFQRKTQIVRITIFVVVLSTYFALKAIMPTLPGFIQLIRSGAILTDKVLFRTSGIERILSSMGGPNSAGGLYAVLIALLLPLLLFGFRSAKGTKRSIIWQIVIWIGKVILQLIGWALLLLFLATIIMSGSRGAMLGLVASLLIMFLIHNHWVSNINYFVLLGAGLLFPTYQFTLYSLYTGIVDETRYVIFQNALELFKMVPFTGLGLGNFAPAYWYFFHEEFNHAHNIYLNTAVELGIIGLILFTILGASFVFYGFQYARQKKDPLYYAINVSLTSVVFGFLVRCLVDYTI